jgi:hypothetical protein
MKYSKATKQRVYDLVHDPIFDKPLKTTIEPKGDIKFITKIKTNADGTKSFI